MAAEKLYLLDANVLITANRDYYPMGMIPEFWDWLLYMAKAGVIKMPLETYEEVRDGGGKAKKDELVEWLNSDDVRAVLELPDEVQSRLVDKVVSSYAVDLDDAEIEQLGRDPFLIAHALTDAKNRVVVSIETSAPAKKRANRKVPDVCRDNGVECCNTFAMLRILGFSTKWKAP